MALFGNRGPPPMPPPAPPSSPPTDRILAMRQQGLSNNQIIQTLQGQGFDPNLIFDGLNQADLKGGIENIPTKGDDFDSGMLLNPLPKSGPPPMEMAGEQGSMDRIEEIAEAIIDEKWNEIVKSINKIIEWKDRTEAQMTRLDQQIADMKSDFDNLTKGVLGKIGEYDSNLTSIGSEIKAMENVFQKVLPTLTESVHTLDRLAKDIKGKRKD
jgi:hypothetical protein